MPPPAELVANGLKALHGREAVARTSDIVITVVPDTPQVEEVLFAAEGIAAGQTPGKLVVDRSSISPVAAMAFAQRINECGCDYLDAPVSGGGIGAMSASLTIMVSGPQKAFDRALPIFEAMGSSITLVGGNGIGQTTKVANQILVALTMGPLPRRSSSLRRPARIRRKYARRLWVDWRLPGYWKSMENGC